MKVPLSLQKGRTLRDSTTRETAVGHAAVGGLTAFILVVSFLTGCSAPPPEQTALPPTLRFIEESPQDIFSLDEISHPDQQFEWTFQTSEDAAPWSLRGAGAELKVEDHALVLSPGSQPRLQVEGEVAIAAAMVDVVEVEFRGLRPNGPVRLFWTHEGEEFSAAQNLKLAFRQGQGQAWKVFRFAVNTHEGWSGQITRLRLQANVEPGQIVHLRRLTGLRQVLSADRFATALNRPWKVMLDGELRSALLALPGVAIERTLTVPPSSQLTLSYGVPKSMKTAVHFLILATRDGAGATPEVILDQTIAPQQDDPSPWQEARIPLDAFAGEQIRLSLQTDALAQPDPLRGLPLWGNPRVVSTSDGPRPPNILLISIDTLRADHMSLYGYERPTSPIIDRWAQQSGLVFETAVAAAPWTLPAHVSLFTGLDALKHGVNHPTPTPNSLETLAEVLRQGGYTTAAVTGGSYLHPEFGLAQGFDRYRSIQGNLATELLTEMDFVLDWLKNESDRKPFFFFFHTYEVHDPYMPREPYLSALTDPSPETRTSEVFIRSLDPRPEDGYRLLNEFRRRDIEGNGPETSISPQAFPSVVDLYDSGIAYTDNHLGRLFQALDDLDMGKDTIVVLTSDHGEALGEHGLAGHGSLYDHDLLVPLIIALPEKDRAPRRIRQQVSAVDLFPTLLELAGLPLPIGLDGRSLVPLFISDTERSSRIASSYAALSNHGLSLRIGRRFKYIFLNTPWRPGSGAEELYDLQADPRETHNLSPGSSQLPPLRESAQAALEEATGLRVHFANGSSESYRGSLNSPLFRPSTVKTPDLLSCCSLARQGQIQFELAPGENFSLFLENVNRQKMRFSGEFIQGNGGPQAFHVELEEDQFDEPQTLIFDGSDWSRMDGHGEADLQKATLTFWWAGEVLNFGASPAESDESLREQLKALGYIN